MTASENHTVVQDSDCVILHSDSKLPQGEGWYAVLPPVVVSVIAERVTGLIYAPWLYSVWVVTSPDEQPPRMIRTLL